MERFESEFNQSKSKKQKREFDAEDRISCLSDDVLVSILSCLPIKVAARTSLLSRRWRIVWTFLPRLEFDASNTLLKIKNRTLGSMRLDEFIDSEKVMFVNSVNHFVELYPLPCIEKFRVCFDLNRSHKPDIDKWVKFVFEKKAKRVELDFAPLRGLHPLKRSLYALCPRSLGLPSSIPLTSLVLKCVDVSDDVLDNFLSNSPFLECLCVHRSRTLVHVRVVGPSLHLKSLEVSGCPNLRSLELNATSLLTLKYFGPQVDIPFENVPNLTTLCIGEYLYPPPASKLWRILTVSPQLQKLELYIDNVQVEERRRRKFPLMSQLKQMELRVSAGDWEFDSLLFLSSWMKACPSLHRFALDLMWQGSSSKRKIKKGRRIVHRSLKVVEITGFVAETVDTELCMFLVESAIFLEKIVVDPNPAWRKRGPVRNTDVDTGRALVVRKRAEHLKSKYNFGDKLVIMQQGARSYAA